MSVRAGIQFEPADRSVSALLRRLANSTVVWSWALNGLRLGSGLIVLPLVLHLFNQADLGMYFTLLALAAYGPIIDFGFSPTIDRFIGYAMGGAETLEAQGVPRAREGGGPNYQLLWEVLVTIRNLYRYLTLIFLVLLGTGGTLYVEHFAHETSSPLITRLAWGITLLSTAYSIYSNWWSVYLRGLNQVRSAAKITVGAVAVKLLLAVPLLLSGAGLLSLPIAGFASSFIQRHFSRAMCLKWLPPQPPMTHSNLRKHLRALWPNSWRLGLQLMSGSLTVQGSMLICGSVYHLKATAVYGPSVQLMQFASGLALVWTLVKWPLISQYQARRDYAMIRRVLWPRVWLQTLTFLVLGSAAVFVAPAVFHWLGKNKQLLPLPWMLCLMLGTFLDMELSTCGTLIATTNRLPFFWYGVAGNILSLALVLTLIHFTSLGLGAFVLAPLLVGCAFNYWYWSLYAARTMDTTLLRFLFLGPDAPKPR
jgi:O-antigen/teichoic acid export membrane protein